MFAHAISSTMPTTIIRTVEMLDHAVRRPLDPLRIQTRLEQRHRAGAASLVVVGERLLELREDRLQVGARLLDGDAGLQPRDANRNRPRRGSYQSKFGCTTSCIDIGTQTDGPPPSSVPVKPFGATPTTVNGVRLSVSVLPTIAGSLPRLRSQKPWLTTTTGVGLCVFFGAEPAAERRLGAEQREVVAGHDLDGDLLRLRPWL